MMSSSENSLMEPLFIEDFNPHGLKVLVVDNDPDSLLYLTEMLTSCQYQVTTCSLPAEALQLIKDDNNKFDIVITEVQFSPDINGVEFLEIIVRETRLPVVIVSADDSIDTITECRLKGACICIPKPAKKEVIKLIWQHVARRLFRHNLMKPIDIPEVNEPSSCTSVEDKELCGSSDSDGVQTDDDQTKDQAKKHRIVWTQELHYQFVVAVKHLGIQNAVPKKILELMNVPGLRRASVASHLQKYRKNLQTLSTNTPHRFTEQSSIIQISGDAYSQVFEDNNSFISTQLITGVQQCFTEKDSNGQVPIGANSQVMENNNLFLKVSPITELQQHFTVQDSSIQVPSGANSHMMENNDLFIRNSPITELQQNFTVQDSSTEVPTGAYHPVIEKEDWEKDWFLGIPPITDAELQTLESELDNHFSFSMTENTPFN